MSPWRNYIARLEVGGGNPLLVRRESVPVPGVGKRILFASDLHLRKDGPQKLVEGILNIASKERPDLILLGGDLVDWRSGLGALRDLVALMRDVAPVGAVGGNHDRWIGLSLVRNAVLAGGGHWLEDKPLLWAPGAVAYGAADQQLMDGHCHVLCSHDPGLQTARRRFQLVLSGHLHGGQFVFYEHGGRLYPGALLYRWNGLRFHEDGSTLLVSRGVRDTLPLRWNCPREVIAVDL